MNKVFRTTLFAVFAAVSAFGLSSCSDDADGGGEQPGQLTADEQEIKTFAQQYLDATLYPTYRMLADSTAILADQLTAMRDKVMERSLMRIKMGNVVQGLKAIGVDIESINPFATEFLSVN